MNKNEKTTFPFKIVFLNQPGISEHKSKGLNPKHQGFHAKNKSPLSVGSVGPRWCSSTARLLSVSGCLLTRQCMCFCCKAWLESSNSPSMFSLIMQGKDRARPGGGLQERQAVGSGLLYVSKQATPGRQPYCTHTLYTTHTCTQQQQTRAIMSFSCLFC